MSELSFQVLPWIHHSLHLTIFVRTRGSRAEAGCRERGEGIAMDGARNFVEIKREEERFEPRFMELEKWRPHRDSNSGYCLEKAVS